MSIDGKYCAYILFVLTLTRGTSALKEQPSQKEVDVDAPISTIFPVNEHVVTINPHNLTDFPDYVFHTSPKQSSKLDNSTTKDTSNRTDDHNENDFINSRIKNSGQKRGIIGLRECVPEDNIKQNVARMMSMTTTRRPKPYEIFYPWLASLQYWNGTDKTWRHTCTGFLFNSRTLVTSGKCIYSTRFYAYRAALGKYNLALIEADEAYILVRYFHTGGVIADFEVGRTGHDFVLARLLEPVPGRFKRIELLPELKMSSVENEFCSVIGWGRESEDVSETSRDIRLAVCERVLENQLCNAFKKFKNRTEFDMTRKFCTNHRREWPLEKAVGFGGAPLLCPVADKLIVVGMYTTAYSIDLKLPVFDSVIKEYHWLKEAAND